MKSETFNLYSLSNLNHLKWSIFPALFLMLGCQTNQKELIREADAIIARYEEEIDSLTYDQSSKLVFQIIALENQIGDTARLISSYHLATRNAAMAGQFEEAIDWGKTGSLLARKSRDLENEYEINNLLSWSYFETSYDLTKNLEHQKRQIYLAESLENPAYKAAVYNNYGYDGTVSGTIHLDEAIEYMDFANSHYANEEQHSGRWYTLMNLTWMYRLKNELSESTKFGKLAVIQSLKDEDRHAIIEAKTNLAETYLEMANLDSAKIQYESILNLANEKLDRDKYVFDIYYSRYLTEIDRLDDAVSLLTEAIEFMEAGEVFYEMLGRLRLALTYIKLNENDQAILQLRKILNPRHEYFAFEVKATASQLAAGLDLDASTSRAEIQAEEIGAQLIVNKLSK